MNILRNNNWGNLVIKEQDYKNISFFNEFAKAFSCNFLHHITDKYLAIKKIKEAIKPGGTVVSLEPNPKTPFYYLYFKFIQNCWEFEKGLQETTEKNIQFWFKKK
ncbi:MAG: hypothetical protein AB1465_05335 [Patescibacteria group bacterium]